jgi:hypothetical protein
MVFISCWARYALRIKVAGLDDSSTPTQRAHVQESRLVLRKRILNFWATQALFMPETIVPTRHEDQDEPESTTLCLPSELIQSHVLSPLAKTLANMEASLRFAQATDALSGVRRSLAIRAELTKYQGTQVRGQHANTRARALLSGADENTATYAARYRRARLAYTQLVGSGDWEHTLKPLNDVDIRAVASHQDDDLTARTGPREGHRRVSWIHTVPGSSEDSTQLNEGEIHRSYVIHTLTHT